MKIFLAGERGMVGSAIHRALIEKKYRDIVTRSREQLDLLNQQAVYDCLQSEKPEMVIVAAARVGGIHANNMYPAQFIFENLMIQCNLIHGAYLAGCEKLLFLGSSCIYPKMANQPMSEGELLGGYLEPTNEPYAIAKIAGIKLCESYNRQYGTDYRSIMPTNLYGPGDNFNEDNSHVIPALIRKFHEAKERGEPSVEVWGTGKSKREFLHVQDMAGASVHLMELDQDIYEIHTEPMMSHLNAGTGVDLTIADLAEMTRKVVGYKGDISFNVNKPDGPPRKLVNIERLRATGWEPKFDLDRGLADTYQWYLQNQGILRK